jgi:hypothetical protein
MIQTGVSGGTSRETLKLFVFRESDLIQVQVPYYHTHTKTTGKDWKLYDVQGGKESTKDRIVSSTLVTFNTFVVIKSCR